jgi:hypothetical protein
MGNLEWPAPVITVEVPEIIIRHDPDAFNRWQAMHGAWVRSGRTDYSVWQEYRELAQCARFPFAPRDRPKRYFPETHSALALQREGFICWYAVKWFRSNLGSFASDLWKQNTEEADRHMTECGMTLPCRFQSRLAFKPKNPDISAFHPVRKEWRFLEAKREDSVKPEQVMALGVLHLLTGAAVGITRLVSEGKKARPHHYTATIAFKNPVGVSTDGQ